MRWLIIVIAALGLAACNQDNRALGVERDRAPGAGQTDVDTNAGDYGRMQPKYKGMPDGTRQGADRYGVDLGTTPGGAATQGSVEGDQRGDAPAQPTEGGQGQGTQPGAPTSIPEGGIEGVTPGSNTQPGSAR